MTNMEKRYLSRGKRIDNGGINNSEWVYGYLITDETNAIKCFIGYVFGTNDDGSPHDYDIVPVEPSTVCRCTGLKDKNGTLIWENDIVRCGNITIVVWDNKFASWCLTKKNWMYHHFFGEAQSSEDCEVIGNKFDNPELLLSL